MIRVVMIEDDSVFAALLKEFLEEDPDVKVVATLENASDAMEWIDSGGLTKVDCVLTDLHLPYSKHDRKTSSTVGLSLVEEIRGTQHFAGTVLILTNSRNFSDGERAVSAGCDGYLCKHAPLSEIPQMVEEILLAIRSDVIMVSREMRHVFMREEISLKEARLVELLQEGKTWAEIADALGYSSAKAAATIGYRALDKILTPHDRELVSQGVRDRRELALERWRASSGKRDAVKDDAPKSDAPKKDKSSENNSKTTTGYVKPIIGPS